MKARVVLAAALLAMASAALAASPSLQVRQAWIRWLPAGLPVAGYALIENTGDGTLRLDSASSPAYRMVMLHHSRLAHSDSTMEAVDHLDIPAHGSVRLSPGGYHLMLSQAVHPIKPGEHVPVKLHFAGGQTIQVDFPVLPANASGPPG